MEKQAERYKGFSFRSHAPVWERTLNAKPADIAKLKDNLTARRENGESGQEFGEAEVTEERKIVIIAGPNGAGKTTFAREFLPQEAGCPVFVNADLIAKGLSPFSPGSAAMRAGRLMLEEIATHVRRFESFAFETTLSGRLYARMIPKWQKVGYRVKLLFLHLPDVQVAVDRVAVRVAQGGHYVSESVIRRRYHKGWRNFQDVYRQMVDIWALYDNSGKTPVLIDRGVNR